MTADALPAAFTNAEVGDTVPHAVLKVTPTEFEVAAAPFMVTFTLTPTD
jgi:hypothetical protein